MKIAVSGKGGTGKTTVAVLLANFLVRKNFDVFAVDADPDLSLGTALGLPDETVDQLVPIVDMREVISELTGGEGAFYSLNPDVRDLLEKYAVRRGRISFLKMGAVKQGGTSCYCRENAVLHALMSFLILNKQEAVVLDMSAGIEHLSRGTARGVDAMVVVTEPTRISLQTATTVARLAGDLGISKVGFIGNKIRRPRDKEAITSCL
ncbi:MAG: AAA family ATPase, partial [Clostridia bacterium]|nr:AAA family ATPase [Clostridia bacterium]